MIRTNAAATMLGVSANTLRSWERRYGFPQPRRSAGGHRHYELVEIEALRQSLAETHNVSSAVALARERGIGPSSGSRLSDAFADFDEQLADRLLEESLALRSIERTIEEVLLPAVAFQADDGGRGASYQFAWRHAIGWLSALRRLAPPVTRKEGVLIVDAWVTCDLDTLHGQALEVILRRAGLRTLALTPGIDRNRLGRALKNLDPRAVVLNGHGASLDEIARLVYAVRSIAHDAVVFDYRGAAPENGARAIRRLTHSPTAARDELLRRFDGSTRDASMPMVPQPARTAGPSGSLATLRRA